MNETFTVRSKADDPSTEIASRKTLEEAKAVACENAVYGCRVCDENGRIVFCPYTELQSDILREAKYVTDYVRENGFTYGDAPVNPAFNRDAKLVSCDRLVDWVMFRVGFTNQVERQGMVVFHPTEKERDLPGWCELQGFERIEED